MGSKREVWVDLVKLVACVLVVLGHFLQSMVKAGIVLDGALYEWFNWTVYTFHVPLFFICSGYLYQRYGRADGYRGHLSLVVNKLLALGVPYLVFTYATFAMKALAASDVNTAPSDGLLETLLLQPTAPYWYLYTLFFMFLVTPRSRSDGGIVGIFAVGVVLKAVALAAPGLPLPYAVSSVMSNYIWFTGGMLLTRDSCVDAVGGRPGLVGTLFVPASVLAVCFQLNTGLVGLLVGVLACIVVIRFCLGGAKRAIASRVAEACARFTMPVFLMHTIFAAGMRIVLLKVGVTSLLPHVVLGVGASFVGPVLTMLVLERLRPLDFVVYPTRYLKLAGGKK